VLRVIRTPFFGTSGHAALLPSAPCICCLRLVGLVLLLGTAALSQTAAFAADVDGTVVAGSTDNRIVISIANPSPEQPIEGAGLRIEETGTWITNIRIETPGGPIPPRGSKRFTVLFDILPEAEHGVLDRVVLECTARGVLLDQPNPSIVVRIEQPEETAEPEEPGESGEEEGPPVLRLVEIKPSGVAGVFARGNDDSLYSVRVSELPLTITPGVPVRFVTDAVKRHRWDSAAQCTHPGYRSHPDNTRSRLTCVFKVRRSWADWYAGTADLASPPHALGWGGKEFVRFCDYAPTFWDEEAGYKKQVPFELEDRLRMTVNLRPSKIPSEGFYTFKANVAASGRKTSLGFEGGEPLFKAVSADADGFCRPGDEDRAELYFEIGGYRPVVLHYRQVRVGEPYISSVPAYRHPSDFDTPPFVGEAPRALALPDFSGRPLHMAKEWLARHELTARLQPGSPAPSRGYEGAVEAQEPPAGSEVDVGGTVALTVHGPYTSSSRVPDLRGKPLSAAKSLLDDSGLEPRVRPGSPAPAEGLAGTVEAQEPPAGTVVNAGTKVTLTVHGPYGNAVSVPDVTGLPLEKAEGRLGSAGLKAVREKTAVARFRSQAGTVSRQQPGAGTRVMRDTRVHLTVYDRYVPTPQEQVAAADCSDHARSEPYWDSEAGEVKCRCPEGLRWDLDNQACVTEPEYQRERCARLAAGSSPVRQADGTYRCKCPAGHVHHEASKRCVKRASDGGSGTDQAAGDSGCQELIGKVRNLMYLYRLNPEQNAHIKQIAESEARRAKGMGCDPGGIRQALGGDGRTGGGAENDCPCVDEQGRPYRMMFGAPCGAAYAPRDYNCSGSGGAGGTAQGGTGSTDRTQKKKKRDRYDLTGRWEQGGNVVTFASQDGVNYVGSMVRVSSDWQSYGIRPGSLLCEVKRISEKRYKGRYLNHHKNGSTRWTGLSVAFQAYPSAVEFSLEGVYGTHNWYRVR